ncbi:NAD(P)-dependent oxidoreductase [Streptomyces sp. IMTB 2501]|uniref:NAD(P)-dependent oxidoreductase n=1 Tax=Streptomyces sp. IMTB 2501 TaxID=1776340 RepID=UPI0009A14149|nr:NAD(P)-dependent oxidoreductase [Streptomyces sp. IMTB 2501]
MNSTTVAVLGTGIMGTGMAHSLRRAGLDVRAWNRTRVKAEPLAAHGVTVTDTAADAVRGAGVVITMLTDGPAVLDTIGAAQAGLEDGQVWLQTSTVGLAAAPEITRFATGHGLDLVDAPVLGTRQPAEAGQLLVFAAGSDKARAQAAPALDAIAARTIWLDDNAGRATATRLKLVVNSWVLATVTGAAEALALAEALGLEKRVFTETIAGGGLDSGYLQGKSAAILSGDYTPSFGLATAAKDARLILDDAAAAGVRLDMAEAVAARFARAVEQGHGDKDLAATYLVSFPQNQPG